MLYPLTTNSATDIICFYLSNRPNRYAINTFNSLACIANYHPKLYAVYLGAALHPDTPTSSIKEASDSDSDDVSAPSTSAGSVSGACNDDVKPGDGSKPSSGGKLAINVPNGHDNKGFEATAAVETSLPSYDVEAAPPYDTLYPEEAGVRSRHHSQYDRDLNSYL